MTVKICGITNLEDARFCAGAGADFLGFIQHPGSPRYIAPGEVKAIVDWIYGPQAVGVFVNEEAATVNRIAEEANVALVQLHGTEPPAVCARIERPVIKAFSVGPDTTPDQLRKEMRAYRDDVAYFLLDTRGTGQWGGTGRTFDWTIARALADEFPLFLAGGISTENVEDAVRHVRPVGVDLSSSLEASSGKKDFDKLQAFFDTFNALREALTE